MHGASTSGRPDVRWASSGPKVVGAVAVMEGEEDLKGQRVWALPAVPAPGVSDLGY